VCRQLRAETLPIFYGANRFRVELSVTDDLVRAAAIMGRVERWMRAVELHHRLFKEVVVAHGWEAETRRRLLCWDGMGFREGVVREEEYLDRLDALLGVMLA